MEEYEKPIILTDYDIFEGVYAEESGSQLPPEIDASVIWTNQNSGSHSDLSVDVVTGEVGGEYIKVELCWCGNGNIVNVGGFSGGYTDVYVSGNTIVFIREGHFNPREHFQFGFNNVVFDSCGDPNDRDGEHTGSYYASGTHVGEPAEFSMSLQCM